jgi:hypothetical protein
MQINGRRGLLAEYGEVAGQGRANEFHQGQQR